MSILLTNGEHTLKIIATNGYAECTFSIVDVNSVIIGDQNSDGEINIIDYAICRRLVSTKGKLNARDGCAYHCSHCLAAKRTSFDINMDGVLDDIDLELINDYLIEKNKYNCTKIVPIRYDIVIE